MIKCLQCGYLSSDVWVHEEHQTVAHGAPSRDRSVSEVNSSRVEGAVDAAWEVNRRRVEY